MDLLPPPPPTHTLDNLNMNKSFESPDFNIPSVFTHGFYLYDAIDDRQIRADSFFSLQCMGIRRGYACSLQAGGGQIQGCQSHIMIIVPMSFQDIKSLGPGQG